MRLTPKQAHVLANASRLIRKRNTTIKASPTRRYVLDGVDCTEQVNSLAVKGFLRWTGTGCLSVVGC